MQLPDLAIFAEVSIALLGFSGLASALNRSSNNSRTFITIRLKALLMLAGSSCFASLAPLAGLGLQYCSIFFAVLISGITYRIGRDFLNASDAAPSLFLVFLSVGWAISGVGFQLVALGLRPDLTAMAYMFALSGTIMIAILFFIRFILALVEGLE